MQAEFLSVVVLLSAVLLPNPAEIGSLLGRAMNPILWVAVFIGFQMAQRLNPSRGLLVYLYVGIISALFRLAEMQISSYVRFSWGSVFWTVIAGLAITTVVRGIQARRAKITTAGR